MFNRISNMLLTALVTLLPLAATTAHAADTPSPEQVVAEFQKVPYYEMFCTDRSWENAEPDKVGEKFKKYFSKEFYKWFMWVQCGQPATPPNTTKDDQGREYRLWDWDMRFGFYMGGLNGSETWQSNVRTESAKQKSPRKAIVKVLYDSTPYELKNIVTTYMLIREDGQWKIDDIAPEGYCSSDCVLAGAESVKAEMKVRYRRTEKELMENAKKGAATKP